MKLANDISNPCRLAPLDLSRWRNVPNILSPAAPCCARSAAAWKPTQFGYSWLLAFMFFLSIVLGAMFLVMMHHLFDAGWSVGMRRFCEHVACLAFPWMALFFIPVALLAPKIYSWMHANPALDHDLAAKWPLFTCQGFTSSRRSASRSGRCSHIGCATGRSGRTRPARPAARARCASTPRGAFSSMA